MQQTNPLPLSGFFFGWNVRNSAMLLGTKPHMPVVLLRIYQNFITSIGMLLVTLTDLVTKNWINNNQTHSGDIKWWCWERLKWYCNGRGYYPWGMTTNNVKSGRANRGCCRMMLFLLWGAEGRHWKGVIEWAGYDDNDNTDDNGGGGCRAAVGTTARKQSSNRMRIERRLWRLVGTSRECSSVVNNMPLLWSASIDCICSSSNVWYCCTNSYHYCWRPDAATTTNVPHEFEYIAVSRIFNEATAVASTAVASTARANGNLVAAATAAACVAVRDGGMKRQL